MNADQRIAEWLSEDPSFDQDGPDEDRFSGPPGQGGEGPLPEEDIGAEEAAPRRGRAIERVWHRAAGVGGVGLEGPEARVLELLDALARRIRRKPMTALTVALGAGFVIGGALSSRVGRAMLAAGARHVVREVLKQLL
jgi:hypothetical protein